MDSQETQSIKLITETKDSILTVKNGLTFATQMKYYSIDFDKVKTIEDVVLILKTLNIQVRSYGNLSFEGFEEMKDKNMLIEL